MLSDLEAIEQLALELKRGDGVMVDVGVALLCIKTLGLVEELKVLRAVAEAAETLLFCHRCDEEEAADILQREIETWRARTK